MPHIYPKTAPNTRRRSPPPSNAPIPRPISLTTPNGIQIQSAVFPQITNRTDRPTDRWDRRQVCENTRLPSTVLIVQSNAANKNHNHINLVCVLSSRFKSVSAAISSSCSIMCVCFSSSIIAESSTDGSTLYRTPYNMIHSIHSIRLLTVATTKALGYINTIKCKKANRIPIQKIRNKRTYYHIKMIKHKKTTRNDTMCVQETTT